MPTTIRRRREMANDLHEGGNAEKLLEMLMKVPGFKGSGFRAKDCCNLHSMRKGRSIVGFCLSGSPGLLRSNLLRGSLCLSLSLSLSLFLSLPSPAPPYHLISLSLSLSLSLLLLLSSPSIAPLPLSPFSLSLLPLSRSISFYLSVSLTLSLSLSLFPHFLISSLSLSFLLP